MPHAPIRGPSGQDARGARAPAGDLVDHVHRPTAGWLRRLSRQANGGRRNRHEPNASAEPTSGAAPNPCPFKLISARADPLNEYHWTRKARGKTVGLKLTEDELVLYREWIANNRELERIVREMRRISSRALALITGREAP